MSDRSLKQSHAGKSNRSADENLVLFSVNRGTSLDGIIYDRFIDLSSVLLKPGREEAKVAKPGAEDEKKKHGDDQLCTIPEVPLGALSSLVLKARNATSKLRSSSATRAGSRSENDSSSRPTRSGSVIRPSNIPTVRSSSAPKKTTTSLALASVSTPKRTVSRSLTPVSRKTPISPSLTPSRSSTTTSTALSFKKAEAPQRSRSLTPRSKPANSAQVSSRTTVRSASASSRGCVRRSECTAVSATPQKLKETVTLAFGRPVGTTENVNSPKRNTSPDVTRTRPKGHSVSSPSLIPTFSGVSHAATPKSVKPSVTFADSTMSGKKLSKPSVQTAINHLDVARNGKVSTHAFSSTMLYPHSIRSSSSGLRNPSGSSEGSCSSNQEEEEGKSLTKEGGGNTENMNDSARYDALLNVKDVKDTNWLLNIDDESPHSLIFENAFDSPPDLFPPL